MRINFDQKYVNCCQLCLVLLAIYEYLFAVSFIDIIHSYIDIIHCYDCYRQWWLRTRKPSTRKTWYYHYYLTIWHAANVHRCHAAIRCLHVRCSENRGWHWRGYEAWQPCKKYSVYYPTTCLMIWHRFLFRLCFNILYYLFDWDICEANSVILILFYIWNWRCNYFWLKNKDRYIEFWLCYAVNLWFKLNASSHFTAEEIHNVDVTKNDLSYFVQFVLFLCFLSSLALTKNKGPRHKAI